MPKAAFVLSPTSHPGVITGPGAPKVLVGGLPPAVVGDVHVCAFPVPPGHPPPNFITTGSGIVRFRGKFAARVGDLCTCGGKIEGPGIPTVNIG
jgi:uncharacterized Zn-binding protein involved in type VI secretion